MKIRAKAESIESYIESVKNGNFKRVDDLIVYYVIEHHWISTFSCKDLEIQLHLKHETCSSAINRLLYNDCYFGVLKSVKVEGKNTAYKIRSLDEPRDTRPQSKSELLEKENETLRVRIDVLTERINYLQSSVNEKANQLTLK